MLLQSPQNWKDYELIDSGNFEKLERFGSYILARPEPKALWDKSLSDKEWNNLAHTKFTTGAGFGRSGKEDSGSWNMLKKMPEQWLIRYNPAKEGNALNGLDFQLRLGLTSFKHVGVFPEQSPNWNFIYQQSKELVEIFKNRNGLGPDIKNGADTLHATGSSARPKVLNLFAYTGAASLAARAAGADTTHLDSVRQVVTWAKGNMEMSGLDNIRWVVEDALKFVKREAKRGNVYNGLILDPPAYGHGPDGEKWKLDELLFELLTECSKIVAPKDAFMVLNLYSNGYSALLADTAVRTSFGLLPERGGEEISGCELTCGELVLRDSFGKAIPLSVFSRLRR
ncbi:MAG: class I SAM-dependent methyltransferase [Bacteroidales bacterium]